MRFFWITLLAATCLLVTPHAQTTVLNADKHGFTIELTFETDRSPTEAYAQFLRVSEWWSSEHTWFGDAKALSIDARAGGCFCEQKGDQEAQHMNVSYVAPNQEIRMTGGLGPLQMMGVHGGMTWRFDQQKNGQTKVTQRYQVSGYMPDGLDKLAPVVDKVQGIQMQRLQARLNDETNAKTTAKTK